MPVVLYWTSQSSVSEQNPRANPYGAQTCFLFSSETSTPNHFPSVGDPLRISTATRNAAPRVTRINLPIGGSHWKCKPRNTPFFDLEWLSCTKFVGSPNSRNWSARYVSIKNPRESPYTSGWTTITSFRWTDSILKLISAFAPSQVWIRASGEVFLHLRRIHLECNSRLLRTGKGLPASAREVPEDQVASAGGNRQQQKPKRQFSKDYLADSEQRCVHQYASHQPVKSVAADIADLRNFRRQRGYPLPAIYRRTDAPIKCQQLCF